jgi:hypothetical protein
MKRDSGQLPVDFLVGFTIFILSLITVANFVPSLLVGLQRTTGIDYDAVAYRTGVVLVEDPGQPAGELRLGVNPVVAPPHPEWDLQTLAEKEFVSRFGLAITRETPNILSINKITRFFDTSFFNDTDYRNKMLFSTYQYGYNITLQNISPMKEGEYPNGLAKMLGDPYPAGYGYIRRYVLIKQNSNATINLVQHPEFNATREDLIDLHTRKDTGASDPIPHQEFVVRLDYTILYNRDIDTSLKIDLQREPLSIRITNLSSFLNNSAYNPPSPACPGPLCTSIANSSGQWATNNPGDYPTELTAPTSATLTAVTFWDPASQLAWPYSLFNVTLTVDANQPGGYGSVDWTYPLDKVPVKNTIDLYVDHLDPEAFNDGRSLDVIFTFQDPIPHTLVTGTFWYDYNKANVTQPVLSTGMLEVGIW